MIRCPECGTLNDNKAILCKRCFGSLQNGIFVDSEPDETITPFEKLNIDEIIDDKAQKNSGPQSLREGNKEKPGKGTFMVILAIVGVIAVATVLVTQLTPGSLSDDDYYSQGDYSDYAADFYLPDSSERYYSEDEIEYLDLDETQWAINEIYARNGRIFTEEPYGPFFNSCEWYDPIYSGDEFDDSWLNEYERANVALLAQHRAELKE